MTSPCLPNCNKDICFSAQVCTNAEALLLRKLPYKNVQCACKLTAGFHMHQSNSSAPLCLPEKSVAVFSAAVSLSNFLVKLSCFFPVSISEKLYSNYPSLCAYNKPFLPAITHFLIRCRSTQRDEICLFETKQILIIQF